jgi:DNA-binding protein H-NS
MARSNLSTMSVDALLKLRDDIGDALSKRADALKKQLASLGSDYAEVGRIAVYGRKKRKVAPKYRNSKTGDTWAGRGAQPVWMREAIKSGKKPDDFLIDKKAAKKAKRVKRAKRK